MILSTSTLHRGQNTGNADVAWFANAESFRRCLGVKCWNSDSRESRHSSSLTAIGRVWRRRQPNHVRRWTLPSPLISTCYYNRSWLASNTSLHIRRSVADGCVADGYVADSDWKVHEGIFTLADNDDYLGGEVWGVNLDKNRCILLYFAQFCSIHAICSQYALIDFGRFWSIYIHCLDSWSFNIVVERARFLNIYWHASSTLILHNLPYYTQPLPARMLHNLSRSAIHMSHIPHWKCVYRWSRRSRGG